MFDCTPWRTFKDQYGLIEQNGNKILINGWNNIESFDNFYLPLADLAKIMTKDMTINVLCAAFYSIKGLHTIGFKILRRDIL